MELILKHFIVGEKMKSKRDCVIFAENQIIWLRTVIIEARTLQVQAKRNNSSRNGHVFKASHREENFLTIPGFWIVVHPVIWLKNLYGSRILVQK
ncbi:hypothetical protein TNCV_4577951 [Trichonephila clavipes]|nr:hypothetical protein TNCV_4577951 [Trichonephila clavipes]